jgi:hypothetical protein
MEMNLYTSAGIMFVSSFLLSYYLNETISLKRNITSNQHKFYMSLFMALQMVLIEIAMYYYFMNESNVYLLIVVIIGLIYVGHKLYTLNFLSSDKQFLLGMIEHHENAIAMSKAHNRTNKRSVVSRFADQIIKAQDNEINQMYQMLNGNKLY